MSAVLLEALRENFAALPASSIDAAALGDSRREHLAAALAAGLPAARAERWRYTSLRALEQRRFGQAGTLAQVDPAVLPETAGPRLVFVNGVFSGALSRLVDLPRGVELEPLSGALSRGDVGETGFLAQRFEAADDVFARMNAAMAMDGMLLRVADGVRCDVPVALVMVGAAAEGDLAVHLRHRVELGAGAALTLVEHHVAATAQAHLVNTLIHVHVQRAAQLHHVRLQCDDAATTLLARTESVLADDAHYSRTDLELGAGLSRHELNVVLQGRGAKLRSNGILLADARRHVDTRLHIDHAAPDTRCDLLWRGLGAGRGRGIFHGGIRIRAGADGSAAHLSNKNLLLSAHAEIDTQPVLEIHADEVQASHGATVGQLDERVLFYLRSRGLPETQARALLTLAFCRVVLDGVSDSALRDALDAVLTARIPQQAGN